MEVCVQINLYSPCTETMPSLLKKEYCLSHKKVITFVDHMIKLTNKTFIGKQYKFNYKISCDIRIIK